MKASLLFGATAGFVLVLAAATGSGAVQPEPFGAGSRIWIEGTSTLRSFSCDVTAFEGDVQAKAGARLGLDGLDTAVEAASIAVRPAAIDCRNRTMNEHALKALKAAANPQISFRLAGYEIMPGEGDAARVRARGQLTMAGKTKSVTIDGNASTAAGGGVQFRGVYPVTMTEWGMTPPSLMLGTIKVGNRINVNYDVILKP